MPLKESKNWKDKTQDYRCGYVEGRCEGVRNAYLLEDSCKSIEEYSQGFQDGVNASLREKENEAMEKNSCPFCGKEIDYSLIQVTPHPGSEACCYDCLQDDAKKAYDEFFGIKEKQK